MKRRVRLSIFSWIITVGCFAIFIAGFWVVGFEAIPQGWGFYFYAGAVVAMFLAGLYYSPMSVRVTDKDLEVIRSLKIKAIPLSDIRDVCLLSPTMGAVRICGSGGFMGYWGWFRERDLGKYFAYYGKASDCFLVVLKNGRKYMLGCKDAPEMVEAIRERMQPA
ncbi:MAG: PH domain-containing protein [Oscillibacter sp.]|nr:PH domain-containing protein [Oscillibacter sp.]